MSETRISEAVARPVRTAVQMAPAAVVTEFTDAWVYDMNQQQYAALFGLLTLLFGFIQTAYENYKGKAFLRNIPPQTTPVVDEDSTAPGA